MQAPSGEGPPAAPTPRGAALGLLLGWAGGASARALGLAAAAWVVSGAPAPGLRFLATWSLLAWLPCAALGLLELPARYAFGAGRAREATLGGLAGLGWGGLLWVLASPFQSLGALGPAALALGGALGGVLVARRARPQGRARARWGGGGLALLGLVAAAALWADPEGRYAQRYAENQLRPADLAAPSPLEGRAPEALSDLELAGAIARTWLRTHPPEELRFSWEEAVALEGVLAWGERAAEPRAAAYARAWLRSHEEQALQEPLWADAAAPLGPLTRLVGPSHPVVARVASYLRERAPRTSAGVPSHVGLLAGGLLPAQAWVDSLFMHGVFVNRLAARRGLGWAEAEAQRLARGMVAHLQDPERGLFRHAHVELCGVGLQLPVEACFWARGNGWAAWFLVDRWAARRAQGLAPDPELRRATLALLAALRAAQQPSGLWRTDLLGEAEPDNPLETSASALFLAAFARARGVGLTAPDADAELLARGRRALRGRVRWEQGHPVVTGTSTGTNPGFQAAYRGVALDDNVGHGVGAVLLALSQED